MTRFDAANSTAITDERFIPAAYSLTVDNSCHDESNQVGRFD